jgi:peptide/nickel transport system permease protein
LPVYILRRLIGLIPVLFGITLMVFSFVRLIPGDPAIVMLGERATPESVKLIREQLGLTKPMFFNFAEPSKLLDSQYFNYLSSTLRGDLGSSIFSQIAISDELKRRWPATLELTISRR